MISSRRAISVGKVTQFDPSEVSQGDSQVWLSATPINLGLDRSHFFVGSHQEVARAAGRIEHPAPRLPYLSPLAREGADGQAVVCPGLPVATG
jgi:hypothetical protein